MEVNIQANRDYYQSPKSLPCDCGPCSQYCQKVSLIYPALSQLLASWQIDCTRPFEIEWIEQEQSAKIDYLFVQYLCFGKCPDNYYYTIEGVTIRKAHYYPPVDVKGEYFILNMEGINVE